MLLKNRTMGSLTSKLPLINVYIWISSNSSPEMRFSCGWFPCWTTCPTAPIPSYYLYQHQYHHDISKHRSAWPSSISKTMTLPLCCLKNPCVKGGCSRHLTHWRESTKRNKTRGGIITEAGSDWMRISSDSARKGNISERLQWHAEQCLNWIETELLTADMKECNFAIVQSEEAAPSAHQSTYELLWLKVFISISEMHWRTLPLGPQPSCRGRVAVPARKHMAQFSPRLLLPCELRS